MNNAQSLVHSALDLSNELHEFAAWLAEDRFIDAKTGDKDVVVSTPTVEIYSPVAFDNYNVNNQCMGVGLRALKAIKKDDNLIRIKT